MGKQEPGHLLTRRQSAITLAALAGCRLKAATRLPVALQLFSLRKQCEADLAGTLAYVRQAGFAGVELAGFYGRTAQQMRELLDRNSLTCCGSHTPLPQLTGDYLPATIEDNRTLKNRRLIIPGLPQEYQGSAAAWKAAADRLNEIAEKLRPVDMQVGYHNHAVEFRDIDGTQPWTILFEHTQSDVILQLDTGNARIGGADPTALVRNYPRRAVTVHVKDYLPDRTDPVIGSSNFDWRSFLGACAAEGATEWYIIEHDSPDREEAKMCLDHFQQFQAG